MADQTRAAKDMVREDSWTHVEIDVPPAKSAALAPLKSFCQRWGLTMSSNYEDPST